MTDEQRKIYNDMMSWRNEYQPRIYCYLPAVSGIMKKEDIEKRYNDTERAISDLQAEIEKIKIYQCALSERYNQLETALLFKTIKLIRQDAWGSRPVRYILTEEKTNAEHAIIIKEETTYSGKERRKAIDDYKKRIAADPDARHETNLQNI